MLMTALACLCTDNSEACVQHASRVAECVSQLLESNSLTLAEDVKMCETLLQVPENSAYAHMSLQWLVIPSACVHPSPPVLPMTNCMYV
jgi:hypothetical protein